MKPSLSIVLDSPLGMVIRRGISLIRRFNKDDGEALRSPRSLVEQTRGSRSFKLTVIIKSSDLTARTAFPS